MKLKTFFFMRVHFCMYSLRFNLHGRMFALIAVYFQTTWETEAAYELLTRITSLLQHAVVGLGGDSDAAVGSRHAGNDTYASGCRGSGPRNEHGVMGCRSLLAIFQSDGEPRIG